MQEAAARNLRTAERFLLAPPLSATFGSSPVAVCDISAKGARFRHDKPLEMGAKAVLELAVDSRPAPVTLEAVIVWTQPDAAMPQRFVSGVRTYGPVETIQTLIAQLQTSHRSNRIEELRSTDRFFLSPLLEATFDGRKVRIENLSARGARIELQTEPLRGSSGLFHFEVPDSNLPVEATGLVMWTAIKAVTGGLALNYRAGLFINEKPELMRLAIGRLCEMNRSALDTQSLRLKLKIIRARARQLAPEYRSIEESGIPAEQYLLIQGVREELRLNPEEAIHWYRRARLIINDPATRAAAPPIANHPDALAVWEYLDRSVDPTIVGRAFELPPP
ncbi:MAG TPA: PilZ domain-containing protein [Thermoanaerobaculia bacterium]|nr:PilZ domain-containing protein [Thermoanaerobaculia bacterium]